MDLRFVTSENYVNKPVNIPCVSKLLSLLLNKDVSNRFHKMSVNVLYYNLFLLYLVNIINSMNKWLQSQETFSEDINNDLINVYKETYVKINPIIRDKLSSKGLSIILNTYTGFDCEYELKSSLENTNSLLSVQLASNTNYFLRVPKSITNLSVSSKHLCDKVESLYGEKLLIEAGERSMLNVLRIMRSETFQERDDLIAKLHEKLSVLKVSQEKSSDYIIYSFPKTGVATLFKYASDLNGKYSSFDLMSDSIKMKNHEHEVSLLEVITLLYSLVEEKEISPQLKTKLKECTNKHTSRLYLTLGRVKMSVSVSKVLYLGMHESTADLSMLSDFEVFKERLDIVQRSFVTLSKPLVTVGISSKVYIRDTILIAPAGARALSQIGSIYGDEFKKIDIGNYRNGNMSSLLVEDQELFMKYGIRDAEITLKHLNEMEGFNFMSTGRVGVPLTMSGIGKAFVIKRWSKEGYGGYLGENGMKLGNFAKCLTPKIARSLSVSRFLVPYITGYRGGRNETFMYGIDRIEQESHVWYDYDLTSAYTTVMSILGHPDTTQAKRIFNKTVVSMEAEQFLFNYIILEVDFEFGSDVKYPSLPVVVGDLEIYPLKGSTIITGPEYLVAKQMNCRIYVTDGVLIPFADGKFKRKDEKSFMKKFPLVKKIAPYRNIIKYLQEQRRMHPKKTFYNYMYKEIGNSIYGQVAMGLGNKTSYDIKTKSYVSVEGGVLSNPILSSYITGFTRAIIGELLNNIQTLNGRVISVTTDGFITDVPDLENKILKGIKGSNKVCLELYKCIRRILTTTENGKYDDSGLEVKNEEREGIIALKTRCQYGFTEGGISAATGFQSKFYNKKWLIEEITKRILDSKESNVFEFVQTGLRSASDVYKHGGNVIAKYSDRMFNLSYDNKRSIIWKEGGVEKLLDSKPWGTKSDFENVRTITDTVSKNIHSKNLFSSTTSKGYKSYLETGVRGFIKVCFNSKSYRESPFENEYGIPIGRFKTYQGLIDFIYKHEPAREVKLSISSVSKLKLRNTISRAVPRTKENELFIDYIKVKIPTFNSDLFFREFSKVKRELPKRVLKELK